MFNPHALIRQADIGDGRHCIVVDDCLLEPRKMVAEAVARRAAFAAAPANCYPGMEQALPPEFDRQLEAFFLQHLRPAFDAQQTLGMATRMSMVTLKPAQLMPQQRICHRDARDCAAGEGAVASVLYLFEDARLGGTSFYRPLRHPEEIDFLLHQARMMENAAFSKVIGAQPGRCPANRRWRRPRAARPRFRLRGACSRARRWLVTAASTASKCSRRPVRCSCAPVRAARRAVFHHVDQGQGRLAFAQVVADVLADLGGVAGVVEHVVDQLEGGAQRAAVFAGGVDLGVVRAGDQGAQLGGRFEQLGGLGADHFR
jgi:hypothetical protein